MVVGEVVVVVAAASVAAVVTATPAPAAAPAFEALAIALAYPANRSGTCAKLRLAAAPAMSSGCAIVAGMLTRPKLMYRMIRLVAFSYSHHGEVNRFSRRSIMPAARSVQRMFTVQSAPSRTSKS